MTVVGVNSETQSGTAALGEGRALVGVCSQERVTRVRGAGVNPTGLPDEAVDLLLARRGRTRGDVTRWVAATRSGGTDVSRSAELVDHHRAHACTAYYSSPHAAAAVVVCDREAPTVTVWQGRGADLSPVDWPWRGPGFVDLFSRCAAALGLQSPAADQRFEALARLQPAAVDSDLAALVTLEDDGLVVDASFERRIEERLAGDRDPGSARRAALASALQSRLADLLVEWLGRVRARLGDAALCLGGSLFYHSSINTRVRRAGVFDQVFVPIDPGNSGLAVGAVLQALGGAPAPVSPFLGPAWSPQEIKEVLDNCKLQYDWTSPEGAIGAAVDALRQHRLVGWFHGGMEWGPRALGARCILANPAAPYVLENLNRFLKRRDPWRGYALSASQDAVAAHFDGPGDSPFMECDYQPRERERFRHVLPSPDAAVRVQTVADDEATPFPRLLRAFGEATGLPVLVNTSFNGFHEPIVCNPRDAVRVFYGSGVDVLVIDQFLLRK